MHRLPGTAHAAIVGIHASMTRAHVSSDQAPARCRLRWIAIGTIQTSATSAIGQPE